MKTTNKMSLRVWTSLNDDFDHEQLADNWAKLDAHDHTNGRGVQIPTEGISDEAITEPLLAEAVADRLFSSTEAYSEVRTIQPGKPAPTTTGRTLVQATVNTNAENQTIEIKVAGDEITSMLVNHEGKYPILFYVPKGVQWEWIGVEANVSFQYRTIEL